MPKRDSLAVLLVGMLFVSAIISVILAVWYGFNVRDLRRLQPQTAASQARLNLAQALLTETLEYSKRNPAIDPLLQSLNLKTNMAPPPATPKSVSQ